MAERPLIVNIRRHSLEDGPGIRTVVFFKGCPLRCLFCQNPETQEPGPEIAFSPEECVQCGACADACPHGAVDLSYPERIYRDLCQRCGTCAGVCPGDALRHVGTYYPVQDLCDQLLRDRAFYRHSGGGVTLSGGECTLYPEYLHSLLKLVKVHHIHVAIETSGYFDYTEFEAKILPYVDWVYYDIKIMDPAAHRRYVGVGNERILDNLRRILGERGVVVRPRIPLIPGITATRENLAAVVDFLCTVGADNVSLLPYNPLGVQMFRRLGKSTPPLPERFMDGNEEAGLLTVFKTIIREKKMSIASHLS